MSDARIGLSPEEARSLLEELAELRLALIEEIQKFGKIGPKDITRDYIHLAGRLESVEKNISAVRNAYSVGVLESLEESSKSLNQSSLNLERSTVSLLFLQSC